MFIRAFHLFETMILRFTIDRLRASRMVGTWLLARRLPSDIGVLLDVRRQQQSFVNRMGARELPNFLLPQRARIYSELHTVSPARFITALKRPATTPSATTLAAQIRTSQPTL
jgi:hypothetical protein